MYFRRFVVLFLLTSSLLAAAELVPVEKFAEGAKISRARLSPDGQFMAFITELDGDPWLMIMNLETKELARVNPGNTSMGLRKEVPAFRWISDRRISYLTTIWDGQYFTGVSAIDRDGRKPLAYSGPDANQDGQNPLLAVDIIHSFDDASQSVLMLDRGTFEGKDRIYPDVVKVNTLNGWFNTVIKNPGDVVGWATDHDGVVRLGITRSGLRFGAIYRENEKEEWRKLPVFEEKLGNITPLGFDGTGRKLVVAVNSEAGRRAVYYYNPKEGVLGEMIARHDRYDIVPEFGNPTVDGISLAGPIKSDLTGTVVGIRYLTEGPQTQWFEPELAAAQAMVDKALPRTLNLITSFAHDEKRVLVFAFSDIDPGRYYLLDTRSGQPVLALVGEQVARFPVDQMAPMFPIKYAARDGVEIRGYLTLPLGEKKKGLPLVVLPHGGPMIRDVWGYDSLVQFLANRGYAVLQMNYRGSPGYGTEFYEKGKREIGRGVQNDIEDGTNWAIKQGIADPARIAIVGGSYGGYSALFGLANSPGLYRCGISIAGVTDWAEIIRERRGEEYKFSFEHWKEWIGDPKIDATFLASISPVNFADRITAPILIMQGKEDKIVVPRQARRMVAALEKAGQKPESLYFSEEGHGFTKAKDRAKMLQAIEIFLALHLAQRVGP